MRRRRRREGTAATASAAAPAADASGTADAVPRLTGFHHVVRDGLGGVLNDTEKVRLTPLPRREQCPTRTRTTSFAACSKALIRIAAADPVAVAAAVSRPRSTARRLPHPQGARGRRDPRWGDRSRAGRADRRGPLAAPDDPWHLRHYRERIPRYYGPDAAIAASVARHARPRPGTAACSTTCCGRCRLHPAAGPARRRAGPRCPRNDWRTTTMPRPRGRPSQLRLLARPPRLKRVGDGEPGLALGAR